MGFSYPDKLSRVQGLFEKFERARNAAASFVTFNLAGVAQTGDGDDFLNQNRFNLGAHIQKNGVRLSAQGMRRVVPMALERGDFAQQGLEVGRFFRFGPVKMKGRVNGELGRSSHRNRR